ncbi:putative CheW protein [Hyella patelloides LEGE 07179]|uniref:Putative CheW protein n=1 Tax=Hyella patelloides LEGE 07179 TaxID=945734 RepID=A0A563VR33_9CYAN|nr:chemotaxis protein CheW [Hyella patelloides]VEP13883.1 putative CheW protein [Hyella patelloides LEGE 07179]
MLNTISIPQLSSSKNVTQNTSKAVAFKVLNYWFALPIEAVLRIIICPPLDAPLKDCLGLVEWDRQTITVIDLAQKLQDGESEFETAETSSHRFLILTQTQSAELCGFLSNSSPILLDIPLENIRSISASYRQVADLSVISKMAILPQQESEKVLKILLLGNWN